MTGIFPRFSDTIVSPSDADTVDERKDGTFVDDGPGEDNKALSLDDRERRSCSNVTTLDENDIPGKNNNFSNVIHVNIQHLLWITRKDTL